MDYPFFFGDKILGDKMPGDTTRASVELYKPIALEVGQRFAVREGNRTVGAGKVLQVHA